MAREKPSHQPGLGIVVLLAWMDECQLLRPALASTGVWKNCEIMIGRPR
jgi:hypothetical protein